MNIEKIKTNVKFIKKIEYHKIIKSTHLSAKELADDMQSDRTLILAGTQTQGVGTQGRKWYSGEEQNILATLILHPKCTIKELSNLTIDIAIKIKEAIEELYGYKLTIKKPNDLMLNGKKICGILTETHTQGEEIKYLIISFGFNVNEEQFSQDVEQIATSLKKESGKSFKLEEILIKILQNIPEILRIT